MFENIFEFTNMNATRKRATDPGNNKGVWYNDTTEEIQAYYGILILMDIITCYRDELYWSQSTEYPYIRTEIHVFIKYMNDMHILPGFYLLGIPF